MSKQGLFDYPTPPVWELQEMYITPYRFSKELKAYVRYMFEHPKYSKHRKVFAKLATEDDLNKMLKNPYLIIRHFSDHPQQYGNEMNNIVSHVVVAMWKTFCNIHRSLDKDGFGDYKPTSMQLLVLGKGKFLDMFLHDIKERNIFMTDDEMVKERDGVGLRERRVGYSEKELNYLCSLE